MSTAAAIKNFLVDSFGQIRTLHGQRIARWLTWPIWMLVRHD